MARFEVEGAAGFYYIADTTTGTEFFKGEGLSKQELEARAASMSQGYKDIEAGNTSSPGTSNSPPAPTSVKEEPKINQETANPKVGENKSQDDKKVEKATTASKSSTNNESSNTTNSTSTSIASRPGKRTWNPLGDFSSYTYRISLYALSPDAHNTYKNTGQWDKTQLSLLVQSGGASSDAKLDAPRGDGFELDYYIDDLELTTLINAKESGMATNSVYYKFKIVEPYGMTFPTKLVQQQAALQEKSKIKRVVKDFTSATNGAMLLTLRFYGYDENGQVVTAAKYNNGSFAKNLDESSTFERSFVIFITKLDFKLEGRGGVYHIECRMFDQQVGAGTKRAELSASFKGVAASVQDAIGGSDGTTTGILDQMNKLQQESKEAGTCEIPDVYAVQFEPASKIKYASLLDSDLNKARVPMTFVKNSGASNARKEASPAAETMKQSRNITFGKGMTIIQAIDQIITQSSYVEDALTIIQSEENQAAQEGKPLSDENASPTTIQWYMISPSVEIIGYDKIRNDYAYKITYLIQSYDVPYVQSTNIKYVPKYPGPHKIYNYFYTGKNSEVISYDQSMNKLFYLYSSMVGTGDAGFDPETIKGIPTQPKPANNADPVGKPSGTGEGANSIKSFLYSPLDQLKAKIKILGDPDFLMPVTSGTIGQMLTKWYGPDFTINPNSGQVFIEIIFNQAEDYTHTDGLLNPLGNTETMLFTPKSSSLRSMIKGTVFMVTKVVSKFSKGRFTQEFTTILPNLENMAEAGDTSASGASGNSAESGNSAKQRESASAANKTASTAARTGVNLSNSTFGGGRGNYGGASAAQLALNANPITSISVQNMGSTPDDDQLIVAGPAYKKEYKQANFYNGELEREHAKTSDPANKSKNYYGLNSNAGAGRGRGY